MDFEVNQDGENKISLSKEKTKLLINKIVSKEGFYKDEEYHDRWTALYNAYDMFYGGDIREEHKEYITKRNKTTRVEFLIETNRINKLLHVISKLYKEEFRTCFSSIVKFS